VDGHSGFGRTTASSAPAILQNVVKLTFARRASLKDPARLFNSSLDGKRTPRDRHPRRRRKFDESASRRSFSKRSPSTVPASRSLRRNDPEGFRP